MTTIVTADGVTTGQSTDGRIEFASCNDGPKINGRGAWRGRYTDPTTGRPTDEHVDPVTWDQACLLMAAVRDGHETYVLGLTEAAEENLARRYARLEGIGRVRGGAYDPGAY